MKKREYILAVVTLLMGALLFVMQGAFPQYYDDKLWYIFLFFSVYVLSFLLAIKPIAKQKPIKATTSLLILRTVKFLATIGLMFLFMPLQKEQKLVLWGYILAFYVVTMVTELVIIRELTKNKK